MVLQNSNLWVGLWTHTCRRTILPVACVPRNQVNTEVETHVCMSLFHPENWQEYYLLLPCCFWDLFMKFDYKFDLHLIRLSCKGLRQIKLWSAWQPPRHPVLCINYEAPCGRRWLLWREANLGIFHLICMEMFLLWEPRSLSLPRARKRQIYSRSRIKQKQECLQKHQEQLAPDLRCNQKLYLCSSKVRSGKIDQTDSWLLKTE